MKRTKKNWLSFILVFALFSSFSSPALAFGAQTSFQYRYDSKHNTLTALYPDYKKLSDESLSLPIPGIECTKFGENDYSDNMVPQGLCMAGSYMLITAYDYAGVHNSVIYVIGNIETGGTLLSLIVLPDKNHVGGIAFDGEYVWVARSTSKEIGSIAYADIEYAATQEICELNYDKKVKCDSTASFITCFNGKIWVGLFTEQGDGTLYGYRLCHDGDTVFLERENQIPIPKRTQGAAFFEKDGVVYLVTSSSWGGWLNSYIRLYKINEDGETLTRLAAFCFPPMTEEVEVIGNHLYVMTESACTAYSANGTRNALLPLDRITAISLDTLLAETNGRFANVIGALFQQLFHLLLTPLRSLFR